ncbi:replication initiator protein A [Fusobacterium mortiferum]|uniref:Replication initiator protein A n=2 Tax=Fusobacterium TaxID=848 RepID=A0ABS2G075_FUSMR|nr:replication initiator protein A [Fusobacterium mortiferum]MBM6822049.1 replication initiator protein A [Fusobacterium mortiferum]MBM6874796.1 replication initiator protein A [Fusobacterium mortiferum]MBU3842975.1 replication initiator protein A [Candidatus Fusobacterium pullicola]
MKKGSLKNQEEIDSFNIVKSGSLLEDIKKVEIKLNEVPNIEVKEVVIKETGNFLNLKDNIINIPVEMIVFPFFTPQKQNKRVNFQYSFEDLGVTMSCTLIAKDSEDKVFQPSIFEEKIYTYLISMYELKKEINDTDDYIEFEISDFIVNFLGNKMNRTYYTKVEQALKNLKNTEYQFVVSNHTKLGNYKFEDEEFKLLTYQKLEKGRKKFYRVTLNKNIRQKIKDKRYIKYNSRSLLEILTKDPIAGRIYKYISKIRYDKEQDRINLRTLAAVIPLKTEQVTERANKNGEVKQYVLCRLKQVLKRVEKAFDVLVELEYILNYKAEYVKSEDTYYLEYIFNKDKDGDCHVSSYIENKTEKVGIGYQKRKDIEDAEIIEVSEVKPESILKEKVTKKVSKKKDEIEFSEEILERIKKAKRNIYVLKAWDKRTDTKIKKIYREDGEERTKEILNILYKNLTTNVKTTLVQYINGIIKNLSAVDKDNNKQNLTLFGNVVKERGLKSKKSINQARKAVKKPVLNNIKDLAEETNIPRDMIKEFESYDEYEKLKIEEKALELCSKEMGVDINFLLAMKEKTRAIYIGAIKDYIERVMKEEKEEN